MDDSVKIVKETKSVPPAKGVLLQLVAGGYLIYLAYQLLVAPLSEDVSAVVKWGAVLVFGGAGVFLILRYASSRFKTAKASKASTADVQEKQPDVTARP